MSRTQSFRRNLVAVAVIVTGLLAWPVAGEGQTLTSLITSSSSTETLTGNARAVLSTVLGTTTVLADTGALAGVNDARDATLVTGSVLSVLSGEVLHAVTIGWPDQVASEASLANLGLTVGGTGISADFVMARALAAKGAGSNGSSLVSNLWINGVPIWVTGEPNQAIWIPGGQVVINEQTVSPAGTTVNALHATVTGVADVVIVSATAGIR